jgi:hypothetical protein
MRHPVEFRDRVEVVDPYLLRANKYLSAWHRLISLAQRSKPHVVGFWLIANRRCMERRPAVRAKTLQTDVSAIACLGWRKSSLRRIDPVALLEHANAKAAGPDPTIRGSANGPRASGIVAQQPSDLAL